MFPFQFKNKAQSIVKKDTFSLWFKVAVACVPSAIMGILFDDYLDAYLPILSSLNLLILLALTYFIYLENRAGSDEYRSIWYRIDDFRV